MTPDPRGRKAISNSPKRFSTMSKPEHPRRALGKGMGALLPTRPHIQPPAPIPPAPAEPRETSLTIPIDDIQPNPLQPRRVFQDDRLQELAQSIRANGIIQPLVVRFLNGHYQLVAGERRLRAAKLAGIALVPVVVREIPDDRLLEITLIENIQREISTRWRRPAPSPACRPNST